MKELLIPISLLPILAVTQESATFWERMAERWGIGLVGMALFFFMAKWAAKRETEASKKQNAREEKVRESLIALDRERADRELASSNERAALLARNNELQTEQINNMAAHATRIEQLTKETTKAITDSGSSMRMLVRYLQSRPCTNYTMKDGDAIIKPLLENEE